MSLKNHWLNILDRKRLHKEIDAVGVEVWGENGTLGDFIAALNDEQADFIMNMQIRDFFTDSNELAFGIEIIAEQ